MPPGVHGELAGMAGIEPAPCGMVTGFPLTAIRPVGRAVTFFTTALPFELHSHACPSFRAASGLSRRHYHCGGLALDVVLELRGGIEPPRRAFGVIFGIVKEVNPNEEDYLQWFLSSRPPANLPQRVSSS